MKRLMILSTGGTIACTQTEEGLVPTLTAEDILAQVPHAREVCALDAKTIFNLDSSNIQPEEWKVIAREVFDCLKDYDGVVVLHGTDTMAYTASMLSFMLCGLDKPVVITGSQLPIGHPHTDAKVNIYHSLLAAASSLKGVYVVFDGKIIRGCRVAKVRTTSYNAFESINYPLVGTIEENRIHLDIKEEAIAPGLMELDDEIDPNVFLLKLIPGTRPEILDHLGKIGFKGVVIEGFGMGGIHSIRRNLLEGIKKLMKDGVAVLLTTQCLYEPSDLMVYEPSRQAVLSGILQGFDMTSESAVTKLMWVLAHAKDMREVRRMMYTSYCGEISLGSDIDADQLADMDYIDSIE